MGSKVEQSNGKTVVLVTGFGAFQSYEVNPASVTMRAMEHLQYPDNIQLMTEEVPVHYGTVTRDVPELWSKFCPKLVIHIGVGMECDKILVEEQSFNFGYISKDIKDQVPCDNVCRLNGAKVLKCKLDLPAIVNEVNKSSTDIPVKFALSQNPGRYLCAFIYYLSLSIDADRVIFVHIPPFKCNFNEHQYAESIRALILQILRHMQIID